jgi:hypothetical protein
MNPVTVLHFTNLFFTGILAGIEFAIHYGVRAPAEVLSDRAQFQLRQALVLRLRVLVPAFFVPTALSGIAVRFLMGRLPASGFATLGCLLFSYGSLSGSSEPSLSTVPRSPGRPKRYRKTGKRKSITRSVSILSVFGQS